MARPTGEAGTLPVMTYWPRPQTGCAGAARGRSSMVEPQPSKLVMRVRFPSPAHCGVARHRGHSEPSSGSGCFRLGAGWPAGGLVVPARIEDQLAEQFAGGGVDDPDVQVLDEHQDGGPREGPADADVVEFPVHPQGELAVGIDPAGAHAVVGVVGPVARSSLRAGCVSGRGGRPVRQRPVRPLVVVNGGEGVQEGLELGEVSGLRSLRGQPVLQRLLEPLDFALGLRVAGLAVLLLTPSRRSSASKPLRPPLPPENLVVKTEPLSS